MNIKHLQEFNQINESVEKITGIKNEMNDNRGPESKVYARGKINKGKKCDQDSDKEDDESEKDKSKQESKRMKITYSLTEWEALIGTPRLQLSEDVADVKPAASKEVDKKNDLEGGEGGLQGKAVQDVAPDKLDKNLVGDDDHDELGESSQYSDAEIAEAFEYFLSVKGGIEVAEFSALVQEAEESNDTEQMAVLAGINGVFESKLDEIVGMIRSWRAKKSAEKKGLETKNAQAWGKAKAMMKKDPGGVKSANAKGKAYKAEDAEVDGEVQEEEVDIENMSDADLFQAITIKYNNK